MTKEKTARLIPNAIQVCTDTEKVCPRPLRSWLMAPVAWWEVLKGSEGR